MMDNFTTVYDLPLLTKQRLLRTISFFPLLNELVGYLSMLTIVDYLPLLTNQWWTKSEFLRPGKINKYKFSVLSLK